jgi:hypothetical protein
MKKMIPLVTVLGVCIAMPAMANMGHNKAKKLDANNDGVVTQAERSAQMNQNYMKEADGNMDGSVSSSEWTTYGASLKDQYSFAGERHDKNRSRFEYKNLTMVDDARNMRGWGNYAPASGRMDTDNARANRMDERMERNRNNYRDNDYNRAEGSSRNADPQRSGNYR